MLNNIITNKCVRACMRVVLSVRVLIAHHCRLFTARGVLGMFAAHGNGDDVDCHTYVHAIRHSSDTLPPATSHARVWLAHCTGCASSACAKASKRSQHTAILLRPKRALYTVICVRNHVCVCVRVVRTGRV
jgi:hypothetical protein